MSQLLGQTICHKDSKLLSRKILDSDSQVISAVRLLYLAIHMHQHRYAKEEAKFRSTMPLECKAKMEQRNIGTFDFECPEAKFLVVPMKHRGLGAVMRTDVAPAFMAGIATGRVVLFVNGSPSGPNYVQSPWAWASCPRKNKQCFFLPDSPCVVTHNEVENATRLEKGERRKLFKTGEMPEYAKHARVVVMDMATRPQRTPPNFQAQVVQIINTHIVASLTTENVNDPRLASISKAVDLILQEDEGGGDDSFGYYGKNSVAHTAMVLYAMRPNLEYGKQLDDMMQQTFSEIDTTNNVMLGLPIRASDKCIDESECPSFDLYMDLMRTLWERHKDHNQFGGTIKNVNIILTSESLDVHQAQQNYQGTNSFTLSKPQSEAVHVVPYDFITNDFDLIQNSGDPKAIDGGNVTKEDVLLSTLGSLKMQLHSHYMVGNCCSNHHLMLVDLLKAGCGKYRHDDVSRCMQDHEDPKFRLCCAWTKTPECLERRRLNQR